MLGGLETDEEGGRTMSIQFQIEEMPDYLAVRFTGTGTVEDVPQPFKLIAEYCKRANKNKLLLDFVGAYGYGKLYLADRYFFGEQAQIFARYELAKVAIVARPERVDPEKFADVVARNRGINLDTFTNVEDAEEWMLKE
jgi:hypothetical protein